MKRESRQELSPLNDSNEQGDDSDHQEHVNEAAHGVGAHHSKQPEDDENRSDRVEHEQRPFVRLPPRQWVTYGTTDEHWTPHEKSVAVQEMLFMQALQMSA